MSEQLPAARIVILGASNVARGMGSILTAAREAVGGPVEILTAMGHGRSYGFSTSIPFRRLPGIRECGIWRALQERPSAPTWSLLTDIGNDLVYGCLPAQVIEWVAECTERLSCLGVDQGMRSNTLVFTALPLRSVASVGLLRFHMMRRALFPKSTLQLADAQRYAIELDAEVRQLAARFRAQLVAPRDEWYGWDPIHIRFSLQQQAWRTIFSSLAKKDFSTSSIARASWRELFRVMTMRAERSIVNGRARVGSQPAVILSDGSSISFY